MVRTTHYSFKNLRGHTSSIRNQSARLIQAKLKEIEGAFDDLNEFTSALEQQLTSLLRNVELAVTCKFVNHIYAALQLTESGLIVDAMLCARNALEMVAFHWLLTLDPKAATEYQDELDLKPFDVRCRLEQLGVDIMPLKEMYSDFSETTHVSAKANRFLSMKTGPNDWQLNFGGRFSAEDQNHILEMVVLFLRLYPKPIMRPASH